MQDKRLEDLDRSIRAQPDKLTAQELWVWESWRPSLDDSIGSLLSKILDWHHATLWHEVVDEVKEEILSSARYQP